MDAKTQDRLAKVEALLRRPGTDGERKAATEARERIYRNLGLATPPLPAEPRPQARATSIDEWARRTAAAEWERREARRRAAEEALRAERLRREARQRAEELRAHEAAARAKAAQDAAFLRRAGCKRLEALLRLHGHASLPYLAASLGQREHSVRALISRMRKAGAPIGRMASGLYQWRGR
jgi:hypothetical protein